MSAFGTKPEPSRSTEMIRLPSGRSIAETLTPTTGAFARALIADPRILILDEATSNVDLHTEARIESGLSTLLTGRTAIVIAHRLSTIRRADRIVLLEHGKIAEQGTHEELIDAGGRYSDLHRDWATEASA